MVNRLPLMMTSAKVVVKQEQPKTNDDDDDDAVDSNMNDSASDNDNEKLKDDLGDDFFVDSVKSVKSTEPAKLEKPTTSTPVKQESTEPSSTQPDIQIDVTDLFAHMDPEIMYQMKQLISVEVTSLDPKLYQPKLYQDLTRTLSNNTLVTFDSSTSAKASFDSSSSTKTPKSTPTTKKSSHSTTENVNEIYNLVIPAIAEFKQNGKTQFGESVIDSNINNAKYNRISKYFRARAQQKVMTTDYPDNFWNDAKMAYLVSPMRRSLQQWFLLASATNAIVNGRHHIARQISHYNWIDATFVDLAVARVISQLRNCNGGHFYEMKSTIIANNEHICKDRKDCKNHKTEIFGIADFVSAENQVKQFKCLLQSSIKDEHLLQVITLAIIFQSLSNASVSSSSSSTSSYVAKIHTILDNKTTTVTLPKHDADKLLRLAISKFVKRDKTIQEVLADFDKLFYEQASSSSSTTSATALLPVHLLKPKTIDPLAINIF
jgi:hypothetical protein